MNVTKIGNNLIAPVFNSLLKIILMMLQDEDKEIYNCGEDLDKLTKSIVKNMGEEILKIDIKSSINFMSRNLELENPVIKAWILSWFNILLTVEEFNLIQSIPQFFK